MKRSWSLLSACCSSCQKPVVGGRWCLLKRYYFTSGAKTWW
jgi:hypothetical protein